MIIIMMMIPILVTLVGIVIDVNVVHDWNALPPITVTLVATMTLG